MCREEPQLWSREKRQARQQLQVQCNKDGLPREGEEVEQARQEEEQERAGSRGHRKKAGLGGGGAHATQRNIPG